ncbi:MAG: sulfatase-like hydrolase/transferase [Microthrixaceae bacterium]
MRPWDGSDSLERNGLAEDTIVVFTSDHGDLLGAHGGLVQKWYNAYEEAVHVPLVVAVWASPPVAETASRFRRATSTCSRRCWS